MLKMERFGFFQQIKFYRPIGIKLCELFNQDEAFQNLINSTDKKIDIIITSDFVFDCFWNLLYVIKMCPFGGMKWMEEWVGNPSPYAYLPQLFSDYGDRMNFW